MSDNRVSLSQYTKNKVYGFYFLIRCLARRTICYIQQIYYMKKISDLSLLFSIILFIIDELVKGINIREVVVRMRSSLQVRQ